MGVSTAARGEKKSERPITLMAPPPQHASYHSCPPMLTTSPRVVRMLSPRVHANMDNVSAPRHVTRLRWRPMSTAAPAGRRLASVPGSEVRGNLNVLGYFSAELCLGTPTACVRVSR